MTLLKLPTLFIIFSLSTFSKEDAFYLKKYEKKIKNIYDIRRVVNKYKKNRLRKHFIDFLRSGRPSRFVGSVGHQNAKEFIYKRVKAFDLEDNNIVMYDKFIPSIETSINRYKSDFQTRVEGKISKTDPEYTKWKKFTNEMVRFSNTLKGIKGENIIWEKKGHLSSDDVLIIAANYDTIAFDFKNMKVLSDAKMPGADQNGTGVVALIGLIEILSEIDLPKTVRIVFFDFEEAGNLGSLSFVKKYQEEFSKKKVAGVIVPFMLGHDTKTKDKSKRLGNMKAYLPKETRKNSFKDYEFAKKILGSGKKVSPSVNFIMEKNGLDSSSHSRFWEAGIPAVGLSQNWEDDFNSKRYHTSNDFLETLNFKTYFNSFKFLAGSVLSWSFDTY